MSDSYARAVRWVLSPKWLAIHAIALALVALFVALGVWQLHRAEGGNSVSYGYALEWPTFALLVVGFWVKIVREQVRDGRPGGTGDHVSGRRGRYAHRSDESAVSADDEQAAELAAYNTYIAERAKLRISS